MLQALRHRTASIFAKGLFAFLVLSFAVWGIGDIFRTRVGTRVVAEVGSADIQAETLLREFQRNLQRLQQRLGVSIDTEKAKQLGLLDQSLQKLIAQTLLDLKAREMGLTISDKLIRQSIESDPAFRNQFGQFDRNVFRQVLANNGLNEASYVEILRRDMARRQLISSMTMFDDVPKALGDRIYQYRNEKRVAEVIAVPSADQDVTAATDAELHAYYDDNTDQFMAPEYRAVTAVVLTPDTLIDKMDVPEQDVRDEYDQRLAEFKTPERRHVEQIILSDEDAAKRAETMLTEGKSFDAVANELTGSGPLDLGEVTADGMGLPALGKAAFALAKGEVSAPVKTPLGWHILRVEEITPGSTRPFEEVRDELRKDVARRMASDALPDFSNRLEDELGGGATLEEAAATLGIKVLHVDAVDQSGKTPAGAPAEGLPPDSEFLSVAFDSEPGVDSFLTDISDGYFILRVDSITKAAPKPFDDVKADIEQIIRGQRQEEAAKKRAEELVELAKGNKSLASIAQDQGLTLKTSAPVTREGQDPSSGVSSAVVAELFKLEPDGVAMAATDAGYAVVGLKEVQKAEPPSGDGKTDGVTAQIAASMRSDLLQQFDGAIRQHHEVTINRPVIDDILQ